MTEYLYRIDGIQYAAPLDEFENSCRKGRIELFERKFEIAKRTPCGAWIFIHGWNDEKKFVNLKATKKYACETIEDAKQSFIARKKRQIRILTARLNDANYFLTIAQNKFVGPTESDQSE